MEVVDEININVLNIVKALDIEDQLPNATIETFDVHYSTHGRHCWLGVLYRFEEQRKLLLVYFPEDVSGLADAKHVKPTGVYLIEHSPMFAEFVFELPLGLKLLPPLVGATDEKSFFGLILTGRATATLAKRVFVPNVLEPAKNIPLVSSSSSSSSSSLNEVFDPYLGRSIPTPLQTDHRVVHTSRFGAWSRAWTVQTNDQKKPFQVVVAFGNVQQTFVPEEQKPSKEYIETKLSFGKPQPGLAMGGGYNPKTHQHKMRTFCYRSFVVVDYLFPNPKLPESGPANQPRMFLHTFWLIRIGQDAVQNIASPYTFASVRDWDACTVICRRNVVAFLHKKLGQLALLVPVHNVLNCRLDLKTGKGFGKIHSEEFQTEFDHKTRLINVISKPFQKQHEMAIANFLEFLYFSSYTSLPKNGKKLNQHSSVLGVKGISQRFPFRFEQLEMLENMHQLPLCFADRSDKETWMQHVYEANLHLRDVRAQVQFPEQHPLAIDDIVVPNDFFNLASVEPSHDSDVSKCQWAARTIYVDMEPILWTATIRLTFQNANQCIFMLSPTNSKINMVDVLWSIRTLIEAKYSQQPGTVSVRAGLFSIAFQKFLWRNKHLRTSLNAERNPSKELQVALFILDMDEIKTWMSQPEDKRMGKFVPFKLDEPLEPILFENMHKPEFVSAMCQQWTKKPKTFLDHSTFSTVGKDFRDVFHGMQNPAAALFSTLKPMEIKNEWSNSKALTKVMSLAIEHLTMEQQQQPMETSTTEEKKKESKKRPAEEIERRKKRSKKAAIKVEPFYAWGAVPDNAETHFLREPALTSPDIGAYATTNEGLPNQGLYLLWNYIRFLFGLGLHEVLKRMTKRGDSSEEKEDKKQQAVALEEWDLRKFQAATISAQAVSSLINLGIKPRKTKKKPSPASDKVFLQVWFFFKFVLV